MNPTTINNGEVVSFYFKVAHTGENAVFEVPTNLCIANFIEFIKVKAREEFNIHPNSTIEIVEACQNNGTARAEDAPALLETDKKTIKEKYNGVYLKIAFYIRVIQ
jgi:hypothetical protein